MDVYTALNIVALIVCAAAVWFGVNAVFKIRKKIEEKYKMEE